MRRLFIFLSMTIVLQSCNEEKNRLKPENSELNNEINQLKFKVDSLEKLPSVKFEKLISQDFSLDSLRKKTTSEYISYLKSNKLKTDDSILMEKYLKFAKDNKGSFYSMYAIDRIRAIDYQKKQLKINQIFGKWKWETTTNLMFPSKEKKDEEIIFEKDKTLKIFKNGKLVSEGNFELIQQGWGNYYIEYNCNKIYSIMVKENKLLTLTKGKGFCIDCGTEVYRKSE